AISVTESAGLGSRLALPSSMNPPADDASGSSNSLAALTAALSQSRPCVAHAPQPRIPHAGIRRVAYPPVATVVATALVVPALLGGRPAEAPRASAPPPAETASVRPAAPPPLVKVRVTSTPQGASVKEDGVEVCVTTPCDIAYELSDTVHTLVVQKA